MLVALAGLLSAVAADTPPPLAPVTAEYRVLRDGIELARAEVRLALEDDGGYAYRSHTQAVGLISLIREDEILEQSLGHWSGGAFVPGHYSYSHRTGETTREVEIEFDWPHQRAINRAGGTTWTMPVPDGTQDKLGQQLVLMAAMGRGLRTIEMDVADGGALRSYRYDVQGRELVRTPAGEFLAWRVRRRKDDGPSRLTLWSAPGLGHLPVRMDRRDGDNLYRMELLSVTLGAQPPSR
jgi:hypothetical protein